MARQRGVTYVNHTFTTHLALSASLQPYAGMKSDRICEYPAAPSALADAVAANPIKRDADGNIRAPEAPGLGIDIDTQALKPYLVDTEIRVGGIIDLYIVQRPSARRSAVGKMAHRRQKQGDPGLVRPDDFRLARRFDH